MPTFLPMMPVTIVIPRCSVYCLRSTVFSALSRPKAGNRDRRLLPVLFPERLDLHVNTGRQIELHQGIDGLRRRLEDVDQSLVRADLELLARLLVDVGRAQHRPLV